MTPQNRERLEKYRPKLKEWQNDQTCHLDGGAKNEILGIIREEWHPGYHVDLWCGVCVVRMMELAFREMDAREVVAVQLPEEIISVVTRKAPPPPPKKKKS